MTTLFKSTFLLLTILLVGCGLINEEPKPEAPLVTSEHKKLIRAIATENGFDASIPIDSFIEYEYSKWPDPWVETNFFIVFPLQDSTNYKTLVLSDNLTKLGKGLRVYHTNSDGNHYAFIDSVIIITDSIISLPWLDLSRANLKTIPSDLGKIRTENLSIRYNETIETISDGIMSMSDEPILWDTLNISYDEGIVSNMNNVSQDVKDWLFKFYKSSFVP